MRMASWLAAGVASVGGTILLCWGMGVTAQDPVQRPSPAHPKLFPPQSEIRKLQAEALKPRATQPYPVSDPTNTGNWVLNTDNSDEFNGPTLDPKWVPMSSPGNTISAGTDPNTGEHCLLLTVTAAGSNSATGTQHSISWISGIGASIGAFDSHTGADSHRSGYGYYEARLKSNTASASSTFFLWGSDPAGSGWTTEIDIIDGGAHFTNPPVASTPTIADYIAQQGGVWAYPGHPWKPSPTYSNTGLVTPHVANMSSTYHTYGLDWNATTITWYVDGVQTYQIKNNAPSAVGATPPGNAFNIPMQVIMDSSFFTGWYGNPIASQLPATTYYDYVRVWTKSTSPPVKQTPLTLPRL